MGHGFRTALRLAATVAAAAAVVRVAASARQRFDQTAPDRPRHRAFHSPAAARPAVGLALTPELADALTPPPRYHAFGPEPSVLAARSISFHATPTADVIELEASGELDESSPTARLLALRHASDEPIHHHSASGP